ncbi:hypothetical protein B0H16DRAFT_384145 [Mycena metata]|uniref:Uncharacterized protein n=1 Tax=Mycena metata TaxID=1033252 RepID=A0AAD7HGW8_9AGAR|nr:hypothetical protein B0H16DRAFT_384145 [Mycena metata]
MDSLKCITANPDITGIGVRIAIYAQNLLCFVPIGLHLWDGIISDEELKGIKDQSIGMLAIAFAILISIIIQAKTAVQGQPITGFHAAVILDLSWMNNTSTWIWFLLYAHHISNADAEEEAAEKKWDPRCPRCRLEWGRQSIPATISAWFSVIRSTACPRHGKQQGFFAPVLLPIENLFWRALVLFIGSVHLSLMAGIGIWLWSHPTQFGTPMDCVPTLTIVGRSVPFTSKPLQIFSLAMYSIIAVPLVNLLPPIAFFLALHIAYNQARRPISRWICFWTGGGLGHVNDHNPQNLSGSWTPAPRRHQHHLAD